MSGKFLTILTAFHSHDCFFSMNRIAKVKKKLFQTDSGSGAIVFPLGPGDENLIPPGELDVFNPEDDAQEIPSTSTLKDNDILEILNVTEEMDKKGMYEKG